MVLACVALPFALAESEEGLYEDEGNENYAEEQYADECSYGGEGGYGYAQAAKEVEVSDAEVEEYKQKIATGAVPLYEGRRMHNGALCMWSKECCSDHCADNKCCARGKKRLTKACGRNSVCCSNNCQITVAAVVGPPAVAATQICCAKGKKGVGGACFVDSDCCRVGATCAGAVVGPPAVAGTCT